MTPERTVQVEVSTLDNFLNKYSVPAVDILKLDTQGTEYQIIEGASDAFSKGKVKMIYTEIITLPAYNNQKEIHEIIQMLYDCSFRLYGIYDPHYTESKLCYVDAIFLHTSFQP